MLPQSVLMKDTVDQENIKIAGRINFAGQE